MPLPTGPPVNRPPAACHGQRAEVVWSRWVSGKSSDWQVRAECVVQGEFLLLSGSTSQDPESEPNQTFSYDLRKLTWDSHTLSGPGPLASSFHACVSVDRSVFVFWELAAGRVWKGMPRHQGDESVLVASVLQTSTMKWTMGNFAGKTPPMRKGYTATAVETSEGKGVVLFGGEDAQHRLLSCLWLVDLTDGEYLHQRCHGDPPTARIGHSAVFLPKSATSRTPKLVIWGGRNEHNEALCDMYLIDLVSYDSFKVPQQGIVPAARWGASLTLLNNLLVLSGGTGMTRGAYSTGVFDIASETWLRDVEEVGEIPPQRSDHYASSCNGGKEMVMFGGVSPPTGERVFDVYGMRVELCPATSHPAADDQGCPPIRSASHPHQPDRYDSFGSRRQEAAGVGQVVAEEYEEIRAPAEPMGKAQALVPQRDGGQPRRAPWRDDESAQSDAQRERLAKAEKELEMEKTSHRELMRKAEEEWEQMKAKHAKEMEEEREKLHAERERLRVEQARAEEMWAEHRRHAEEQRQQLEEDIRAREQWEREQEARMRAEQEEIKQLRVELTRREEELAALAAEHKRSLEADRAEIRRALQELEAQKMENETIRRKARDLEADREELEAERRALEEQKALMAEHTRREHDELRTAMLKLESTHLDIDDFHPPQQAMLRPTAERHEVEHVKERGPREEHPAHEHKVMQEFDAPPPVHHLEHEMHVPEHGIPTVIDISNVEDISAVSMQPPSQDGALCLSSSQFLDAVYHDALRAFHGNMPLSGLLKVLKSGGLLLGSVTIDTVLDVLHAAQIAMAPSAGDSIPPLDEGVDSEQFKMVVVDLANRLYGRQQSSVDMGAVEEFVSRHLKQVWGINGSLHLAFEPDRDFDLMTSIPVAEVLHRRRLLIFQLFARHTRIPYTPGAEAPEPHVAPHQLMSASQLLACFESSQIIPHLITSQELLSTILLAVTDEDGVSPAGLTECICRSAFLGFTDNCPSAEKVARLLDSPELFAAAGNGGHASANTPPATAASTSSRGEPPAPPPPPPRGQSAESQGSVGTAQTTSRARTASPSGHHQHQPGKKRSVSEMRSLLRSKTALRDEMQRIYLYYASLPGGAGCSEEGVTLTRWTRLCTDIGVVATHRHYAQSTPKKELNLASKGLLHKGEVEQVFADVLAESKRKRAGFLSFDGLMVALRRLACRLHPALASSPNDALHRLLLDHILPNALQVSQDKFTAINLEESNLEEVLDRFKKSIMHVYTAYCGADVAKKQGAGLTMQQFLRFATDFSIVPGLLSKAEAIQVFRSGRFDISQTSDTHNYETFLHCLVRVAHVAFSKHPYSLTTRTLEQKVVLLLERLGFNDLVGVKQLLERVGLKVSTPTSRPSTPPRCTTPKGRHAAPEPLQLSKDDTPTAKPYPTDGILEDEDGLDAVLKGVFAAYSSDSRMGVSSFTHFCKEAKITTSSFTDSKVEQCFSEASQGLNFLTFDGFCDSLLVLGGRRYPTMRQSDALRSLLVNCVIPWAARK
eukprot:Sspe_Gene.511::Locus_173_Transcript_3_4_Confidence_0.333_Length_4576::g.511::m.511